MDPLSLATFAVGCAMAGVLAWFARGTRPLRGADAPTDAKPVVVAVPELVERVSSCEAENRSLRLAFAAFVEEAEAILEAVDRKRKQAGSHAARAERAVRELDGEGPVADADPNGTSDRAEGKRRVLALMGRK